MIEKIARAIVPEGPLKDWLAHVYYEIWGEIHKDPLAYFKYQFSGNGCTIEYSRRQRSFQVNFTSGNLQGSSLLFPFTNFRTLREVGHEVESYFAAGLIPEGSVVVDAGAFPGDFTVLAAQMVGKQGKVIALEPHPEHRRYLEETIQLNGVQDRVEVLDQALSDHENSAFLLPGGMGSHLVDPRRYVHQQLFPVRTTTLDCILNARGLLPQPELNSTLPLQPPVFIKMDIEGSELPAYEGAKETIEQGARFAIAAYHLVDGEQTLHPLKRMFKSQGYRLNVVDEGHLVLYAEKPTSRE